MLKVDDMSKKLSKLSNSYFKFVETQQLAIFSQMLITMLGRRL